MNSAEDALKAVEALAEIVREWILDPDPERRASVLGRLNGLRTGCEALRMGKRGADSARIILDRPEPGTPPTA